MSVQLHRVERTVQIVVAKPLAWALYCLLRTEPPAANGAEPKQGAWQRQS